MDEETTLIDSNTRNEKIRNFFINNKKKLITIFSIIIITLLGCLLLVEIKAINKVKLANKFNSEVTEIKKEKTIADLINIINKKDATYSPLALYYLIDNNLSENKNEINNLFDLLINEANLEKEIKNLLIYKKALYNANLIDENELIEMLSSIINSESIWKSHALYLIAEYFYSKNEKTKAKEFFNQILLSPSSNQNIRLESQKRINRDLSE